MSAKPVTLGRIEVLPIVTSRFRLDGGSMFGVVPRVLWGKKAHPDEHNRIILNTNSLLVKAGDVTVLVETGMGSKYGKRQREKYALDDRDAAGALPGAGLSPDDIDLVVLSHLHFDHAGGSTRTDGSGELIPAFGNARYMIQESEWKAALEPHPLAKGSYLPDDFMPLMDSGRLELVAGSAEVAPGVRVELTGGHTPGHQVVRLESDGREAIYLGDLVPTTAHLRLNWIMAWDMEPPVVYTEKERVLTEAAEKGLLLFWSHDPGVAAARIERSGGSAFTLLEGTVVEAENVGQGRKQEKGG